MKHFNIKIKTATGTTLLDGPYPSADAAWADAWRVANTHDAAICVKAAP